MVNEEQASVVRRIFADYFSGMGIARIAKGLREDGIALLPAR
ncbi:hypothetical protein UF75_5123 [Desulfosporosinus sp. I2]|nr:recombinase family protein [Desulfosporosinus sp. I2]KJR44490.1 hypothetical protein UF75_5123 [Desulfosporosinus sp. I2]